MRYVVFTLMIVVLLSVGSIVTLGEGNGTGCTAVSGTIWAVSIPRFDGEALVGFDVIVTDSIGPLAGGKVAASLDVTRFLADGSIEFVGNHYFTGTDAGTFVTADHGITTAAGGVADMLTIVGGGTGFLVTLGHIDLATGKLELDYHGMVCRTSE